jgi:hypothetical protein
MQEQPFAQGCQMLYFQARIPNLGAFCRMFQWKMLVYFMSIWYILQPFGIFYSRLVYFTAVWYIFWLFGIFFPVLVCCSKKNLATLAKLVNCWLFLQMEIVVCAWFDPISIVKHTIEMDILFWSVEYTTLNIFCFFGGGVRWQVNPSRSGY